MRFLGGAWAASVLISCAAPPSLEPEYVNIERVVRHSCGTESDSCHGGSGRGNARLNFGTRLALNELITEEIVGVESCEYDFLDIVAPGDPENSWLMYKLDHMFNDDGDLVFEPDPDWDPGITQRTDGTYPPSECPLVTDEGELSFGSNMPNDEDSPRPLSDGEIEMFREWIELGALGPEEDEE